MNMTWILVAHRSGARLFENKGPGKGMTAVEMIDHPDGRLKNHEIGSDKPGRSFDSRGGGRHAYGEVQLPTEHLAEQFAKQLASLLDSGRTRNRYARLVLVAEPRFLGLLRAALSRETAALVTTTLDKDLGGIEARDLPQHLAEAVRL